MESVRSSKSEMWKSLGCHLVTVSKSLDFDSIVLGMGDHSHPEIMTMDSLKCHSSCLSANLSALRDFLTSKSVAAGVDIARARIARH